MPDCVETFAQLAADQDMGKQKAPYIAAAHPGCACETTSVHPQHSPGPVAGGELLIRCIYSPHHIEPETGLLRPTAFDDACDKGLSVDRMDHSSAAALQQQIAAKLAAPNAIAKKHEFKGVAVFRCQDARDITYDANGQRSFGVYDTATATDPAHADVCQVKLGERIDQRRARLRLIEQCGNGGAPETDLGKVFTPDPPPGDAQQ